MANVKNCAGEVCKRRSLRLRSRQEDTVRRGTANLFARLAPSVVEALISDVLPAERGTVGWALEANKKPVSFLPLSIKFNDNVTIFASYNGGDAGAYWCEADEIV